MAGVHRRTDLDIAAEQAAAERPAALGRVTRRADLDTAAEQAAEQATAQRRVAGGRVTRRADLDIAAEQAAAEKHSVGSWFTRNARRARVQFSADVALRSGDTDGVLAALADDEHARVTLGPVTADRDGMVRRAGLGSHRIAYAGARAHVEQGHTSRSSGLGVFVPVGPISVGLGGGRSRSTLVVVVNHPDGQWRDQFPDKQAAEVHNFVALINTAAVRCSNRPSN